MLTVIVAALAIATTRFYWYAYPKATGDLRKTLETVKLVGLDSTGVTFTVVNPTDVPIRIDALTKKIDDQKA